MNDILIKKCVYNLLFSMDIMRWNEKPDPQNPSQKQLHKYFPSWSEDNFIVKYHHKLETFPPLDNSAEDGKVSRCERVHTE